ncbi:MAG: hypothetical protein WC824_15630 [Bacteroidota bacterium]
MKEMPENSVRAFIVDPPYGLEFLGADWDKIGKEDPNVGKVSNAGFSDGTFKGFHIPNYGASANVKCRICGRWKWDHIGKLCVCEEPDFPFLKGLTSQGISDWHETWLREVFRVLKPGGIIKAFAAARTYHRLAQAMRRTSFEILRIEAWVNSQGFPKSMSVPKVIDAQILVGKSHPVALSENERSRPVVGISHRIVSHGRVKENVGIHGGKAYTERWHGGEQTEIPVTASITPEARRFQGFGTSLKPAWEPFLVGRKPE